MVVVVQRMVVVVQSFVLIVPTVDVVPTVVVPSVVVIRKNVVVDVTVVDVATVIVFVVVVAVLFVVVVCCSEESAPAPLVGLWRFECGEDGLVEDVLQTLLRQRRTFHEFHGLELLGQLLPVFQSDGPLTVFGQFLHDADFVPQIDLSSHN